MFRIIELAIDDIVWDPAGCSAVVTEACAGRNRRCWTVTGAVTEDAALLVLLAELPAGQEPAEYRFAPLSERNGDILVAELKRRYYAGFDTVGAFGYGDELWALFRRAR
ncbi:hypothetical protein [Victivallis sp. Marseille-Q1083]|uniref:hypothetical protein n=1 Tax=Victivallis sp. Marseille-Q1083 TaxID=2717288 RepID=UPI00158CDA18|nr:hypothetical protein [Victivallis sp. Marseille-Q1083]